MRNDGVAVSFPTASSNLLSDLLPYIFIIAIGAAFIYFIGRQTKGQMSGIMSIGRSKAKTFSSDRRRRHSMTSRAMPASSRRSVRWSIS